jgi:hypothetical protein
VTIKSVVRSYVNPQSGRIIEYGELEPGSPSSGGGIDPETASTLDLTEESSTILELNSDVVVDRTCTKMKCGSLERVIAWKEAHACFWRYLAK